ncbi:MAG: flavin reductase [Deltaproteobacteria bacterium]|nr:flavin reductase [Deltaproteobacteria bacterium]
MSLFVDVPLQPRFFQASAFFPMPIVLIATRGPDGAPNLAPYSLCFPHVTDEGHRLVLVMRSASKTAANLERSGRAAINFIPDEPRLLDNVKLLSQPGTTADKMARSAFTLEPSPLGPAADGTLAPPLVAEAIQAFECRLVSATAGPDGERRFVLEVERVRMRPRWARALERGLKSPRLPIDYGFRRGSDSWMSHPRTTVSGPRVRPAFAIEVARPPDEVLADLSEALARPDAPIAGKVRDAVVQITMPAPELTTWSPHVDLRVDARDDGRPGAIIRGRIGPQPHVWTTFMFFHLLIAFFGLGGLMWGVSQALADEPAWALWALPIALFLHAFVAGAAFIGQGLSSDQTHRIRTFLDDVVSE